MSDYKDEIEGLEAETGSLRQTLETTTSMVSTFDSHLRVMRESLAATGKDVATLEKGLSKGLRRAFDGLVFDGESLSSVLNGLTETLSRTTYNAAIKPVTDHVGGLIANGVGGLMQGVLPFASGGIVSGATPFGMRGGMGVMGEAGPEAIMPLARGADGKLGVRTNGGGGAPTVVMNISTPDVQGFARSQSQIASQVSRALARGHRNR